MTLNMIQNTLQVNVYELGNDLDNNHNYFSPVT